MAEKKRFRPTVKMVRELEEEVERLERACETLNKINDRQAKELQKLKSRGFWARVFNK